MADSKRKSTVTGSTAAKGAAKKVGKKAGRTAAKKVKKAGKSSKGRDFSEKYLPFILGAVGFVFTAFFICHAISGFDVDPDEHIMGVLGYYICQIFFGLLGWTAFCIPLVLFNLAFFWRKYCKQNLVAVELVLSVTFILFIATLTHVFAISGDEDMLRYKIAFLYEEGAMLSGGGVIGGLLGFLFWHGLKLPGTLVVMIPVLLLMIMVLVGITPAQLVEKIRAAAAASKSKANKKTKKTDPRKEKKVSRDDDDEDDEILEDDDNDDDDSDSDSDDDDGYVPAEAIVARRSGKTQSAKRTVEVDTETGEIVEDKPARDARDGKKGTGRVKDEPDGEDEDALYVPPKGAAGAAATVTSRRTLHKQEKPVEPTAADEDDADTLYVPGKPIGADPKASDTTVPEDGGMDSMEVSFDDDADTVELRNESKRPEIVVNVLPQDRRAVTGTSDNHVDGLPDEEVVVPTHTEGEAAEPHAEYVFPPIDILKKGKDEYAADQGEIARNVQALRTVLEDFNIRVQEVSCSCGPTVTRFEVKPEAGVRVRSIANLVDDIAMGLAKSGVRIEAPIPGKAAVGIEVPNEHPSTVALRNLLETPEFKNHKSRIAACLGADVSGRPVIMDINKMPHLLVAGATGMGKSVCINSIIMSILYKAKPEEVKLILIDPKQVEFTMYRDLPHLYAPIVTDPKKAAGTLNAAVNEMERRFQLIRDVGVRNIAGYNEITAGDPERPPLPLIVIIIDEFADLMMTASQEVETSVCRLAQKARAAGIHIIIGTQRPSVDVITGLIKSNIPSRIAFTVASSIDSRTILDGVGAEKLIGRGDMLYSPVGISKPMRVQGTFVSDSEVEEVVSFISANNERGKFDENFARDMEIEAAKCGANGKKGEGGGEVMGGGGDGEDAKYWDAVELAVDAQKISTSLLQRRLEIGYGRAAKIIDRMEEMGFVGPAEGTKPRKLLITKQDLLELQVNGGADADDAPF